MNSERVVDMGQCGPWRSAGVELWNVVDRSWCVFARNTRELLQFLSWPSRDPLLLPMLINQGPNESSAFWEELDQRLHNNLSSAVSLVDHTRRLIGYYEADVPAFTSEFSSRNDKVRILPEAAFLRDLRNYLLHYGIAPIVVSLSWQAGEGATRTQQALKLDAWHLLNSRGYRWKHASTKYLEEFDDRDGPVLAEDVLRFAEAMRETYDWLFEQRGPVLAINPERFLIPWPVPKPSTD